ncbi:MAG: FHA domain-containing protein [Bacteroidia bacterium]
MANRATQSLTTGMKILGGANIPTYTLEYLTSTDKHKQGSYETIVVPYIELGRDKKCGVSFGDDTPTVSRRHCAIERKGNETFIVNLSTSNPTLVNSRPVNERFFLNNGDEIQLSMEGPKLRFNTTKTGTAKMGFTNKMNLVMQQAIKPYKTAAIAFLITILVLASGGTFAFIKLNEQNVLLQADLEELEEEREKADEEYALYKEQQSKLRDSLQNVSAKAIASVKNENRKLRKQVSDISSSVQQQLEEAVEKAVEASGSEDLAEIYQAVKNHVYFMRVTQFDIVWPDGRTENLDYGWTCTGFMVEGGKFITARHCIQSWRFINNSSSEDEIFLNSLENDGAEFKLQIECSSPTNKFTINYSSQSGGATLDDTNDQVYDLPANWGDNKSINVASLDKNDWATFSVGGSSDLIANGAQSYDMSAGDKVIVLGYSYGLGGNDTKPLLSESLVAQDGVSSSGSIALTNRNFGQGNSGGPVLFKDGDNIMAIGIVSAGIGAEIGFIVPVGECK